MRLGPQDVISPDPSSLSPAVARSASIGPRSQAFACPLHVGPRVFYRKQSPEKAVVRLQLPKRMGARAKFIADVIAEVRKIEQHCDAERSKHGTTVKGRAGYITVCQPRDMLGNFPLASRRSSTSGERPENT
jgi:hypothetical protein